VPDLELDDADLVGICRADFHAAKTTRVEIEGRRLAAYQLYRAYDENTNPKGGQFATRPGATSPTGQFGWSRLTVPIGYIGVETILSRMVLNNPEIVCYGESPEAAGYAQAKAMRIKRDLKRSGWNDVQLVCLKDSAIYGDGFTKTVWDTDLDRPTIAHIPWFDFYYSPEAMQHDEAEVHWHVTWHSVASLRNLQDRKGGDKRSLYQNIDELILKGPDRSAADDTYLQRRQYSGAGTPSIASEEMRQIPIVEGWYKDGTVVTLGGAGYDILLRAVPNPYVDPDNRPWRPFDTFAGTTDPESPYSISIIEMIEDMQREASTLTRQAIDQATRNINRPTAYDSTRVRDTDVIAAYGTPGGRLAVQGDPSSAIDEGRDVQVSRDWETAINRVMQLAQMTIGISDESAGMPPTTKPGLEDTATASWLRAHERNRRVGYLVTLAARTMRSIARKLDNLDRQYNRKPVTVPITKNARIDPAQQGIDVDESGRVATIDNRVNDAKLRYELEVDEGSLEVGFAGQKAARAVAFAQALSTNPMLAQQANWHEVAAVLAEASGFDPMRLLITQQEGIPEEAAPGEPQPPGPLPPEMMPPGLAPGAPAPVPGAANGASAGGVPVGAPVPLPGPAGTPIPAGLPPELAALMGGAGPAPVTPDMGALPMGMPVGPPSPEAPAPTQPIEITINVNSGGGVVTKRIVRDPQGQIAEIHEVPQEPEPEPPLPPSPPDLGGVPPELLDPNLMGGLGGP
jgi:hypothetical protein